MKHRSLYHHCWTQGKSLLRTFSSKSRINKNKTNSAGGRGEDANLPSTGRQRKNTIAAGRLPLQQPLNMFASCLPGLEPFLQHELGSLGFMEAQISSGGVQFAAASTEEIFKCHLFLGTASHIYLRAGPSFQARGMDDLRKSVTKLPFWSQYLLSSEGKQSGTKPSLDIRVVASKSRLYHTKAIADRVERGICNALGVSVDAEVTDDNPSVRLLVRIHRDEVQVSVDSSTTPLHQRGYRLETAKAPLREDLAYGLLYSAGFTNDATVNLLDPFCGSGTIPIEAAAMAYKLPPGRLREAPLQGLTLQNGALWKEMVTTALKEAKQLQSLERHVRILGSDRNEGGIDIARRNAKRAGVEHLVEFEHNAISSNSWLEDPSALSFLVATNPPFGHRLSSSKRSSSSSKSLLPLYQTLGHKLVSRKGGDVDVAILGHDAKLVRRTGIPDLKVQYTSKHGGMNVFALGAKQINSKAETV